MSIRLVEEVLDKLPKGVDPAARIALVALAEKADEETRQVVWRRDESPAEVLTQRTGMDERALQRAFAHLATYGLDPRVPIKHDKHGRPVYAYRGRATQYRIPRIGRQESHPSEDQRATVLAPNQGGKGDRNREKGRQNPQQRATDMSPPSLVPVSLGERARGLTLDGDGLPVLTSPRCDKHRGDTTDAPCRACGDARQEHERTKAARADAIERGKHERRVREDLEAQRTAHRPPPGELRARVQAARNGAASQ